MFERFKAWRFNRQYKKDELKRKVQSLEESLSEVRKILKMDPLTEERFSFSSYFLCGKRKVVADLGKGVIRTLVLGDTGHIIEGKKINEKSKR